MLYREWERILAAKEPFKYEYEIETATGERKWVIEFGQGVYNNKGEVEAPEGLVLDISDRKSFESTLKYNSEHDNTTGLYNRDYIVSLLRKNMKEKRHIKKALIGINLSTVQLLVINYGYHYIQKLIKIVAEKLANLCSNKRVLATPRENRFIFYLLGYQDRNDLISFCDEIIKTIEPVLFTERIGYGIGVVEIEEDSNLELDTLLRRLLIASERSINTFGKDYEIVFYYDRLEALVNRERDIIETLKAIGAGEKIKDEFFLHFQPIVDVQSGKVAGYESLARLKTEKYGLVPPVEFIPIAEMTKLILPLGEKIIIQALDFISKLKETGYDNLTVSINISVIQLLKPDFSHRLMELIKEKGINPRNVGIEITETVFASDNELINKIIMSLRAEGIYIAIDDFGTGYSSLAREHRISVDCMKIDKFFIDKLLSGDINKQITGDIISMSHKLGHCSIAEGVEHPNQLQYLKEHNCDKIQGYLISKPLCEKDALEFLKNYDSKIFFELLKSVHQ